MLNQTEKKRGLGFYLVWFSFALIVTYVAFDVFPLVVGNAGDRRSQRQQVSERIQAAGGWEILRKDCMNLAEQNRNGGAWSRYQTNGLSPMLVGLLPLEIRLYPEAALSPAGDEIKVPVAHIKIFGLHSTGGHSTPYYGLDVVCSTNSVNYSPPASKAASGNSHGHFKELAERIFEIY